jgi:probable HAF family extracellular repeat protein
MAAKPLMGGTMKKLLLRITTIALLVAPCLAQYNFITVDYPGASNTQIFAVNNAGRYAGAFYDAQVNGHAMYFDGKKLRALDPRGVIGTAPNSFAFSLNNRGDIAGSYTDASGSYHGYLYNHGKITDIDFPGGFNTQAYGVNDLRQVIGVFTDAASAPHAFLLRHGVYKQIDLPGGVDTVPFSINNFTEIVGEFVNVSGTTGHGYLQLKNGKFTLYDAPHAAPNSTYLISINNPNQIVGFYFDTTGMYHNFLLEHKKLTQIKVPRSFKASFASFQTINDSGDIVGYYNDQQKVSHGFVAMRTHKHSRLRRSRKSELCPSRPHDIGVRGV